MGSNFWMAICESEKKFPELSPRGLSSPSGQLRAGILKENAFLKRSGEALEIRKEANGRQSGQSASSFSGLREQCSGCSERSAFLREVGELQFNDARERILMVGRLSGLGPRFAGLLQVALRRPDVAFAVMVETELA